MLETSVQNDLAADPAYLGQVAQCAIHVALNVAQEAVDTNGHDGRFNFAQSVLLDDGTNAKRIARAIAAVVSTNTPTDDDVIVAINSVWNAFSRVSAA